MRKLLMLYLLRTVFLKYWLSIDWRYTAVPGYTIWVSAELAFKELLVKCNKGKDQEDFSEEEGHGDRREGRRGGRGQDPGQRAGTVWRLCDLRDGVKAEAQAREKTGHPLTWLLREEPLHCNILEDTAKTRGIVNFYLRYRSPYSSCCSQPWPSPVSSQVTSSLWKMKDKGQFSRSAKYSIPIRLLKMSFAL